MKKMEPILRDFLRDDAGSPLGRGMPSGSPLRADGESHYGACTRCNGAQRDRPLL